jgi:hypothetical protein
MMLAHGVRVAQMVGLVHAGLALGVAAVASRFYAAGSG